MFTQLHFDKMNLESSNNFKFSQYCLIIMDTNFKSFEAL